MPEADLVPIDQRRKKLHNAVEVRFSESLDGERGLQEQRNVYI